MPRKNNSGITDSSELDDLLKNLDDAPRNNTKKEKYETGYSQTDTMSMFRTNNNILVSTSNDVTKMIYTLNNNIKPYVFLIDSGLFIKCQKKNEEIEFYGNYLDILETDEKNSKNKLGIFFESEIFKTINQIEIEKYKTLVFRLNKEYEPIKKSLEDIFSNLKESAKSLKQENLD